jgi:putative membrane protein
MPDSPEAGSRAVPHDWRRLSPWAVMHFAARSIAENARAAIFGGGAGTYGLAQSNLVEYAWLLPIGIAVLVLVRAVTIYLTSFYRLRAEVVEVKRGLLFRHLTNLPFARVQNISIERPFYFRPLGLVTLRIDGAGSQQEEVHLPAIRLEEAERLRAHIATKRRPPGDALSTDRGRETTAPEAGSVVLTRSLGDLATHGLTNNRSQLVVAGLLGMLWQSGARIEQLVGSLGVHLDSTMAQVGVVTAALLVATASVLAVVVVALLSVIGVVVIYHRFTIRSVDDSLVIERGLFTRHETLVRKSRIQTVIASQDWLERLVGRRNVILEQVAAAAESGDEWPGAREKIFIPALRPEEMNALAAEIPELCRIDDLAFTPLSPRYFRKGAMRVTAVYLVVLVALLLTPVPSFFYAPVLAVMWPVHVAFVHLRWKRGGLAIHDGIVVARSGALGIDHHVFQAFKIQQVSHVQSGLMRRADVSHVIFRTASNTVKVPYLTTAFARRVVNYCAYAVESSGRSWM